MKGESSQGYVEKEVAAKIEVEEAPVVNPLVTEQPTKQIDPRSLYYASDLNAAGGPILTKVMRDGTKQTAALAAGPNGFLEASFGEGGVFATELPNIMLMQLTPTSVKKCPAKAAKGVNPPKKKRKPARKSRKAAELCEDEAPEEKEDEKEDDNQEAENEEEEEDKKVAQKEDDKKEAQKEHDKKEAEKDDKKDDGLPTKRSLMWYKKSRSIGIRQKYGSCRQIMSFGGMRHEVPEARMREFGKEVVRMLDKGSTVAKAKREAKKLMR